MKTTVLHISEPSSKLLEFVRELQADKEASQRELREKWDTFFPAK